MYLPNMGIVTDHLRFITPEDAKPMALVSTDVSPFHQRELFKKEIRMVRANRKNIYESKPKAIQKVGKLNTTIVVFNQDGSFKATVFDRKGPISDSGDRLKTEADFVSLTESWHGFISILW